MPDNAKLDWKTVAEETTKLLSELLQLDTTNPPGNEKIAADYLQGLLSQEGIESQILESAPGRSNLIARLKGRQPGKRLMLLSHTDVVPVNDPDQWKYPPFSGVVAEGYVWGRGALDMKSMTATETMVMLLFKRLKLDFAGELILAAVADEEQGSSYGGNWLVQNHPDLMRSDYVLNEGGGMPLQIGEQVFYTVDTTEKGLWWVRLRFKGAAGHASVPHQDNAIAKSARLIDRLAGHQFPKQIAPAVQEFFVRVGQALGPQGVRAAQVITSDNQQVDLKSLLAGTPLDANLVYAFTHTTCSPTMIRAGVKENVIPARCEFVLDFRFVPGYSREQIEETIEQLAGELAAELEIETIQHHPASESPISDPFYQIIAETVRQEIPGAQAVPYLLTGATDSRFMRQLGAAAYGFSPLSTQMSLSERTKLVHSANERIDIGSLKLGVKLLYTIARRALQVV
ncbi:MAG TPA: M20/M25/M40 family metallo-hydrolase [Candidatus Fraserbacteria bacterium]|nr:M20/M25/M40 family metallo-hydrolase [Candidatus Fraserbacteria bacterium]